MAFSAPMNVSSRSVSRPMRASLACPCSGPVAKSKRLGNWRREHTGSWKGKAKPLHSSWQRPNRLRPSTRRKRVDRLRQRHSLTRRAGISLPVVGGSEMLPLPVARNGVVQDSATILFGGSQEQRFAQQPLSVGQDKFTACTFSGGNG